MLSLLLVALSLPPSPSASACLTAASTPPVPLSQEPASPLQDRLLERQRGRALLESLKEHLAPPRHRMEIQLQVQIQRMTHGAKPGSVREDPYNRVIRVFSTAGESESGQPTDSFRLDVERTSQVAQGAPGRLRITDAFVWEDEAGPRQLIDSGADSLRAQLLFRAAYPYTLVHWLSAAGRVRSSTASEDGGATVLIECGDGEVLLRTVPIRWGDTTVPGLVGFEWVTHDRFLGDYVESLTYDLADDQSGPEAPGVVAGWTVRGPVGTGETAKVVRVTLDSAEEPFVSRRAPSDSDHPMVYGAVAAPSIEVRPLADGVLELLCGRDKSRSIAVDLGRGWAVLEAPVSTRVGEALIRTLEAEKPGHPFLYAAASHHHPHYIGGLRPFVHRGAAIVCPEDVAPYVEHIVTRPWTLQPDELARSQRSPRVIGVEQGERWAPPESEDRLVAMESDGRSNHTEAFLVFFLPENQLAFGGDLLWLRADGRKAGPNPRTRGLAAILRDAEDLGAQEFLTSWPVGGPTADGKTPQWLDRAPVQDILRLLD